MPPRSPRRRPAPVSAAAGTASPCPCGLPAPYGECCGRFHGSGASAPTAESLMRSRYSAFVVRDEPYLLRTWHPATRPPAVDLDPGTRWTGLEVVGTEGGSAFHTAGTVVFRARYRRGGRPGVLHERSRFERHGGAWVYVDGVLAD